MTWQEAQILIRNSIFPDMQLPPERVILAGPNYECHRYDYNGCMGYKVKIGKIGNITIEIPFSMLENVFMATVANCGVYNKDVFRIHYPTRAEQATGHPCYVHAVGQIFVVAGVAEIVNKRNFRLV